MTSLFSVGLLRMSIGLVFFLAGMGCATTSDLEQLDQGLTRKLQTLDSTLQSQVHHLRRELKTVRTNQENSFAALTDEINKRLYSIELAVENVVHLPSLVTDLSAKMQELRRAVFATYELEEAALRDRLQVLEQFRRRLGPLPAESSPGPTPAAVTTAPREENTQN